MGIGEGVSLPEMSMDCRFGFPTLTCRYKGLMENGVKDSGEVKRLKREAKEGRSDLLNRRIGEESRGAKQASFIKPSKRVPVCPDQPE